MFVAEAWATTKLVLPWMSLALTLESLMQTWLPAEVVAPVLGTGNAFAIPLAVLVGTPLYLDGYAALPLIQGLLELGMSPSAALAFLVSGGITSLYAALAVFALICVPVFVLYLALAVDLREPALAGAGDLIPGPCSSGGAPCRGTGLVPALRAPDDRDDGEHHRHLDQHAHDREHGRWRSPAAPR